MEAEFLYNPDDTGIHAHCATLHETHDGSLFAVWYAHPDKEDYKNAQLCITKRRTDGSWEKARPLLGKFNSSVGNPLLYQVPGSDRLWLLFVFLQGTYWNDAVLHSSFSDDGGYTWSPPAIAWPDKGLMVRHPPVVLADNTLLLPAYDEINFHSLLLEFQGEEWGIRDAFPDTPLIQPSLFREQNGQLTMFFRPSDDPRLIWRAHSKDEAKSWSPLIRTSLPCPLSGVSGFALENLSAVVYNHSEEKRTPLSISVTLDSGITWSDPWHLDEVPYEISYPHFMCTADKMIHGVYTYNRRMIKHVTFSLDELRNNTHTH